MARINPAHMQGHPELLADLEAMLLEIIGCSLQPMVHMEGMHLPRPPLSAGQQQSGRVSPAAEGHSQRQSR
jgi:hypothetical protein